MHPHRASRLRAFHEIVTKQLAKSKLRLVGEPVWPEAPRMTSSAEPGTRVRLHACPS
jgi:hypothetical protein